MSLHRSLIDFNLTHDRSKASIILQTTNATLATCEFRGNNDLYGLGIRLGYYAQGFAICIGTFFAREAVGEVRAINTMFTLAMFAGLVLLSIENEANYGIEAYLLLQLICTSWKLAPMPQSVDSRLNWDSSLDHGLFFITLRYGILCWNVWFWWVGLDVLKRSPCETWILYFWKVNLYGVVRQIQKVLSIFLLPAMLPNACFGLGRIFMLAVAKQIDLDIYQHAIDAQFAMIDPLTPNHLYQVLLQTDQFLTEVFDRTAAIQTGFEKKGVTIFGGRFSYVSMSKQYYHGKLFFEVIRRRLSTRTTRFRVFALAALHLRATLCWRSPRTLFPFAPVLLGHPRYPYVCWQAVYVVTAMRRTHLPPQKKPRLWFYPATLSIVFCVLQILSVELTLRWNHISGLQGFRSIGQLVPFVLGVGGLFKIVYSKAVTLVLDHYGYTEELESPESQIERMARNYYVCKSRTTSPPVSRTSSQPTTPSQTPNSMGNCIQMHPIPSGSLGVNFANSSLASVV